MIMTMVSRSTSSARLSAASAKMVLPVIMIMRLVIMKLCERRWWRSWSATFVDCVTLPLYTPSPFHNWSKWWKFNAWNLCSFGVEKHLKKIRKIHKKNKNCESLRRNRNPEEKGIANWKEIKLTSVGEQRFLY